MTLKETSQGLNYELTGHRKLAGGQLLMWIALTLGVFFRFYNLEKKFYWHDEAYTALWLSGHSLEEFRTRFLDREVTIPEVLAFQRPDPHVGGVLRTPAALAESDPQHPPLYYVLLRIWVQIVGDSVWGIRSFSAVASLLALPCLYWLCRELFTSKKVAQLATALVSLSPFHVLYAQEAREYSLWTLTTLLCSIALYRAAAAQTRRAWLLYSFSVVLGLYTHTLHLFVLLAHAVYIFVCQYGPPGERHRGGVARGFLAAAAAALLAFSPWIWVMATNLSEQNFAATSWATAAVPIWRLMGMWGFNFGTLFFDADTSFKYVDRLDADVLLSYGIQGAALIVSGVALYHLWRKVPWRPRVFLLSLVIVPVTLLTFPDLILGGMRSGPNRFFVPSFLGVEIAVASLLVSSVEGQGGMAFRIRRITIVMLLVAGLISCAISSQAETWWTRGVGYWTPQVARVVNSAERPLLIMRLSPTLLSLSHSLHEKVRVWVVGDPRALRVPQGFSDVFVYDPSEALLASLKDKAQGIKLLDRRGVLHWMRTP